MNILLDDLMLIQFWMNSLRDIQTARDFMVKPSSSYANSSKFCYITKFIMLCAIHVSFIMWILILVYFMTWEINR